jgi:integrase
LAAKPARLTKNRHGIFCLRWIVPLRFRDKSPGATSPREIRISLRTADPQRARILALEFNLALERLQASMTHHDPRFGATPFTLTLGGAQVEIRDDNDRRQFTEFLHDNPDMREAVLHAIRSGTPPSEAMASLIDETKRAVGAAAPVKRPEFLKAAVDDFVKSLETMNANRRSTAGDKRSTLKMFQENLIKQGCAPDSTHVHELDRSHLIEFVKAYAARPAKSVRGTRKTASGSAPASGGSTKKVSPRSVIKVIEHLQGFFVYALAMNWIAVDPVDDAFHKATANLRKGAASAKRGNSYALFEERELQAIFEPSAYLQNLNASDDFWAPLIGLYTGARLGEIVTLDVDDIAPADGNSDPQMRRHVLTVKKIIRAQAEGPKNSNSVRKVPIARKLIDLGLLDYVQHVKSLGARTLFPHRILNKTRENDPSKHLSRVFGKHLDAIDLSDSEKVFHSLRHTVVTWLHVRGVPVGDAELIVGHAAQDTHARMSAVAGRPAGRSSTHLNTYVDAAGFSEQNMPLMQRLQQHVDRALDYPLDFERLRAAARIVQEQTVRRTDGKFASGWHTNNHVLAQQMLDRLAAASVQDVAVAQVEQPALAA